MRGRTTERCSTPDGLSYVQINIYDTNISELRERGVDIKTIIEHIGCRSLIMDVPILIKEAHTIIREAHTRTEAHPHPSIKPSDNSLNSVINAKCEITTTNESTIRQDVRKAKSSETIVKDEVLFEPRDSKDRTLSITSTPLLDAQKDSGHEIFNDNAQIYEASSNLYKSSVPTSANGRMVMRKANQEVADQIEHSFSAECSQIDGIHALKLMCSSSRPTATAEVVREEDVNESHFLQDQNDDEGGLEIEPGTSHMFSDLSFDESDLLYGNKLLDLHENMVGRSASSLLRANDSKQQKRIKARYRSSTSKDRMSCSADGSNAQQGECRVEKKFLCRYPKCDVKVSWRPRYGKNRLVDHVRIHWGKKVKKCPSCDYVATHQRKILYHFKMFHRDTTFTGVQSLETKEDMEELLRLWKQCFPDAVLDEFCDSNVARIQRARPALSNAHPEVKSDSQ